MEPITVVWNGTDTVQESLEAPDESQTCGEYAKAFADAHGIDGAVYLVLDGEDVPDDAPIDLLGGEKVFVRVDTSGDVPKAVAPVEYAGVALDDMTVKQLRAYAHDNDITLGDARNKTDIREAIDEAERTEASADVVIDGSGNLVTGGGTQAVSTDPLTGHLPTP